MLQYALVENVMTTAPHNCIAVVSSPEVKGLNDVIDCMIAEGTGLTRPQAMAYFEKLTQTIEYFLGKTIWQETVIIKFDSCSTGKDSITGMCPIKEIIMSHSIRKKESQSTQVDFEQESWNQSNVEFVQEQSERLEKETTQSRFPPKLKQWHLLIFLIALNCIFAYLFFCKK